MQIKVTLAAGQETRIGTAARNIILLDLGAAASVDMKVELTGGFAAEELTGLKRGFTMNTPGYAAVVLKSAVDCVVQLILSNALMEVNSIEGANINATIVGQPVQVVNDRGAPGNPVNVVGITYSDAPAISVVDNAAIAVTSATTVIKAANAARRELRFRNAGPGQVALGAPGTLTWAKAVVVLDVGDMWVETRGANLAWNAICDAGVTASVTAQEVIS